MSRERTSEASVLGIEGGLASAQFLLKEYLDFHQHLRNSTNSSKATC